MATFLADKSALTRRETRPEVREVLEPLLVAGQIATCGIVDLELLYSAPQAMLAERAQHRAVPLPDLLVAACAERAGLAVLHYDGDFERIAELTGQATQWIVPRGSVS